MEGQNFGFIELIVLAIGFILVIALIWYLDPRRRKN